MAGENQGQQPGDGVKRPVIPLQNTEQLPAIEIIDEDESGTVQRADQGQPHPEDKERAGQYEYVPEGEEGAQQGNDARLAHFQKDQTNTEQPQPGETPEQLSARQRRRQRDKDTRNRERTELAQLRVENTRLKQGLQHVDARVSNVERAGIDGQISSIEVEIKRADTVMARAMEAQNGSDFVQAQEIRDQFRDRLSQLKAQKAQGDERSQAQEQEPTQARMPNGLTQAQVSYARIFAGRHPWFNTNTGVRDGDSDTVRQIDGEMMAAGMNPSQPAYWVELERRIQEDMPHKFQESANDGGQQSGGQQPNRQQQNGRGNGTNGRASGGPRLPGGGSGGAGAGNGGPVKFHLSKARKDAMVASGAWDDSAQRDRQIRYFMKWDAENPAK